MALFKRMREMAQQAATTGCVNEPSKDDDEGIAALRHLRKIWKEMARDINGHCDSPARGVSENTVMGKDYYQHTLERIRIDEALVLDEWTLGHDAVSYVKDFQDHEREARAQELLSMGLIADHVSLSVRYPEHDRQFSDVLSRDAQKKVMEKERRATRLVVRRDWMDAFAQAEDKPVGITR